MKTTTHIERGLYVHRFGWNIPSVLGIFGALALFAGSLEAQEDLTLVKAIHHGLPGSPVPIGNDHNNFGYTAAAVGSDRFAVGIPSAERIVLVNPSTQTYDIIPGVGAVYLYANSGNTLVKSIYHPNYNPYDGFGLAMAPVGPDRFLVGAPAAHFTLPATPDTGAAYLYDYNGNLLRTFYAPDPKQNDGFGFAMASVGNTLLLIGEPWDDFGTNNAGLLHGYNSDGTWRFTCPNPTPGLNEDFGLAVAGVGTDRFVVAAPYDDTTGNDAGRVYLYETNNTLVKEIFLRNDTSPDKLNQTRDDWFGFALAGIGQDRFVVGAPGVTLDRVNLTNGLPEFKAAAGMVFIYDHEGNLLHKIKNPSPESGDRFGSTLAALGPDRFLVGAPATSLTGLPGKAFVFNIDGELLLTLADPAPPPNAWDLFGQGLAGVGDEEIVVGAPQDDFNEQDSGSAYIYHVPILEYVLGSVIPPPPGLVPTVAPEVDPEGAAWWQNGQLYAAKAGKLIIHWRDDDLIVNVQAINVWPSDETDYQLHVTQTPAIDVSDGGRYPRTELLDQDETVGTDAAGVRLNHEFSASGPGRSLLLLSTGKTDQDPIFFQFVKSVEWQDPDHLHDFDPLVPGQQDAPIDIGQAVDGAAVPVMTLRGGVSPAWVLSSVSLHDPTCGGPYVFFERSRYCPWPGYYDRATRTGPVIPVNRSDPSTAEDDLVVVFYQKGSRLIDQSGEVVNTSIDWPWKPVRYDAEWPATADPLVIANNNKPPIRDSVYPDWALYYQNDRTLPGFNPNDEHAIVYDSAIWPLRNDLNYVTNSEPYVLMTYRDPVNQANGKIEVFHVLAEQPPDYVFAYEGTAGTLIQPPGVLSDLRFDVPQHTQPVSGPWWRDNVYSNYYAKAAGNLGAAGTALIEMRYSYKVQESFFVPDGYNPQNGVVPWLDLYAKTRGIPLTIPYTIHWPAAPEMKLVDTLVRAKNGLPDLEQALGVEIIYQQSMATGSVSSAQLIDPVAVRSASLHQLPPDIKTLMYQGKLYFPDLPPHLRQRLAYDPVQEQLQFWGEIVELTGGDPVVLLNVLTPRDRDQYLLPLSADAAFTAAANTLYNNARNTIPILDPTDPVEAYALTTGYAEGTGFVTLALGNDPNRSDTVSLQIIKVVPELEPGQALVIESGNPFDERLTLRHSGDFAGRSDQYLFEWKTIADLNGVAPDRPPPDGANPNWGDYSTNPQSGQGAVDVLIAGPGKATLSDNWFVCRYTPTFPRHPLFGQWSEWTAPQLAEGWIKRVLGGIGPFAQRAAGEGGIAGAEQKFSAWQNREVNTLVDMIGQAGPRWVGDVPFNPDAVDDFGLIETYETVFRRGIGLSIEGTPPEDYGPANKALQLVAGRLADLYMLLGNEAYADASDPTIGFGTSDPVLGSQATSIHCFMNQTANLLDEELALLRGRDDRLSPGVTTYPFYNKLVWNFTGDIAGGEVAYVLNYAIRDVNQDGAVDELDAKIMYPQGHGDAWGHYLTAINNYYRLIRNDHFTWEPRTESVLVGNVPVTVDYLDERKFAQAAAARARTGAEIVNLTYRQAYVDDPEGRWQGYKDEDPDRAWGLSEWGSRAGQGAFFDWVTGNAILPPTSLLSGIQKIDRTTVTELSDIAAIGQEIQAQVDLADMDLNPLGLARNVVPFDIDPQQVSEGRTQFDQVYDRAVLSLNNAVTAFDNAQRSSQSLREQADVLEEFERAVADREADFNSRLIEIFGTPYPDDVGPGGAYETGYNGPDLIHYNYVDPALLFGEYPVDLGIKTQPVLLKEFVVGEDGDIQTTTKLVAFHLSVDYGEVKPPGWLSGRATPGDLQLARGELVQSKLNFESALTRYDRLVKQIQSEAEFIQAQHGIDLDEIQLLDQLHDTVTSLNNAILQAQQRQLSFRTAARQVQLFQDAQAEMLPLAVGLASDPSSVARGGLRVAGSIMAEINLSNADRESISELNQQQAKEEAQSLNNIELTTLHQEEGLRQMVKELEQLVREEAGLRLEIFTVEQAIQQAAGRYYAALSRGLRLWDDRTRFRQQTAARTTGFRYRDMAFRIFRNDALQKYRAQFDFAARAVYLAAKAYDFETNFQEGDPRGPGRDFMRQILSARVLGAMRDGIPQPGTSVGDPGLADALARMWQNWQVLRCDLDYCNPQYETTRFSLRQEWFRIAPGAAGNAVWRQTLEEHVVPDLLQLPEFQRYCIPFYPQDPAGEPAIVIDFPSTVNFAHNFFGWEAAGGDNDFDSTHFATKIRSVGLWFANYNNLGGGMINTPRVYLVPAGSDVMRSPTDRQIREWTIVDQVQPVPFPLSLGDLQQPDWQPADQYWFGGLGDIRRYGRFRAYHDSGTFDESEMSFSTRLIGRSVWNTRWLLIIPAGTLHYDRQEGLARFIHGSLVNGVRDENGVSDIKLLFQAYSMAGY
jgi:FG-GAP repeat